MSSHTKARIALFVLSALCIGALIAVSGCSTIEGIGRDIQGAVDGMSYSHDTNGGRVPSGR